jgi:hypothetical protein
MANIKDDIHPIALAELKKKFSLNPVALKHPFPDRPVRTLGLVKIDGEVFSSEKFSRAVFLRVSLPVYVTVRSTFLRPRMEFDLPVFSSDIVITGKKRMFIVDIHRTGIKTEHDDSALFDKLIKIKERYPDLLANAVKQKGKIQSVFSRASCQVKITEDLDEQALSIFREYLGVFMEMVEKAEPLSGEVLEQARKAYEEYLKTIVDHDPGMQGYKLIFGKKGGIERSMNIHFEQ